MQRRRFTEEFKREAVKLTRQPGATKAAISRDLGIGANILGKWCSQDTPKGASNSTDGKADAVPLRDHEAVQRELAKVKMERDILKKALGYFAADPK